jgi:hypothetical protein
MARSQVRGKWMTLTISDSYFAWESTFTFAPRSLWWSFYTSTAFWNKYSVKVFLAAIEVMGYKVNNFCRFESSVMLQCVSWQTVACFFKVKKPKTCIWCAWPCIWRQHASLKRWSVFAHRHGIISQKSWIFISHVLRTTSFTLDSSYFTLDNALSKIYLQVLVSGLVNWVKKSLVISASMAELCIIHHRILHLFTFLKEICLHFRVLW